VATRSLKILKPVECLFIDLDGTLIDTLPAMYSAHLEFLKIFGITGSRKREFDRLNGPSLREVVGYLKKKYRLRPSNRQLLDHYRSCIQTAYQKKVFLLPGARRLLAKCHRRKIKLVLVTAAERSLTRRILSQLRISHYFNFLVCGDDVQRAKPHPQIYRKALHRAKIKVERVLVFEDSRNGVRAARAAGLEVVALSHHVNSRHLAKLGAKTVIKSLEKVSF
jgi:HAD superfamily hydrolase (TIGR01509 family)